MKLKRVYHETRLDKLFIHCDIEKSSNNENLTLTYEIDPVLDIGLDRADPFVLPCLLMAMENGEDLHIAPPVSTKLFHNIHYSLIFIIGNMLSLPQNVKVYASETTSDRYPQNKQALPLKN